MSRGPLMPRAGVTAKARRRMAPGGRLWSESPVLHFRRPVSDAGGEEELTGYAASSCAGVGASPPYVRWQCTWSAITDETLTAGCVGRMVFTLSAVDAALTWFRADTIGFSTGPSVAGGAADPHYPSINEGFGWVANLATGARATDVTGGPFTVGEVITFDFAADMISTAPHFGSLQLPGGFATTDPVFYVVSP